MTPLIEAEPVTMTNAVVLIEAERNALSSLGGELADIEGVAEAYSVTGEWDFVAIVGCPHHEQLADVVTEEIGGLPGVDAHADDGRLLRLLAARPRIAVLDRRVSRRAPAPLMAAVPVKPEYGPTLGRLLSPRWRAAGTRARKRS